MVTHDPRVAAAADRLLVMEDGRFTAAGAAPGTAAPVLADLAQTGEP
jgi:ABC-type lipoprotein export system ATPase subunit